jgi:hypothetical protein
MPSPSEGMPIALDSPDDIPVVPADPRVVAALRAANATDIESLPLVPTFENTRSVRAMPVTPTPKPRARKTPAKAPAPRKARKAKKTSTVKADRDSESALSDEDGLLANPTNLGPTTIEW